MTSDAVRDEELDEYGRSIDKYWELGRDEHSNEVNIFTIKIINPTDAREMCEEFEVAKADEVNGLKERAIWTIVNASEVPEDANVLGGRFILSLKNCDTPDEKAKVRYVAQGFDDHEKPYMVHDTSTLRIS